MFNKSVRRNSNVACNSYNQITWSFLNDNKTHFKSAFGQSQPSTSSLIKSISKPKFTTANREYGKPKVDVEYFEDQEKFEGIK